MVLITQLVYVHPGKEELFEQFEAVATRSIAKHGGEVLLRLRPTPDTVLARTIELPYEVHVVRFADEAALASFANDEDRLGVIHLKEHSVRAEIVVRGTTH